MQDEDARCGSFQQAWDLSCKQRPAIRRRVTLAVCRSRTTAEHALTIPAKPLPRSTCAQGLFSSTSGHKKCKAQAAARHEMP